MTAETGCHFRLSHFRFCMGRADADPAYDAPAMTPLPIDRWSRGWRGPLLAALIALAAALPGLMALPVTDRGEARLAEASAQMLETGDFTATAVDDQASDRRPAGLHWLQAAAVAATSQAEARHIWAYRLPALAGAMIASAACAWGGAALFGDAAGLLAGALLGSSFLLSTAGAVDAPAALLCGGVTLAVSALGRLYLAAGGGPAGKRRTRIFLWLGIALAGLAGGPVGPAAVVLTGAALWLVDRKAPWLRSLGWGWGLILLAALVGPSLVAGAMNAAEGSAPAWPAPLLFTGGARTPGFHLLLSPLLLFPFTLLLPPALALAWRGRREPGVKLALCWLIPSWLVLEFGRGQPLAGGLLVYGALAWLAAAALTRGAGAIAARIGAALQILAGAAWIAATLYVGAKFGGPAALTWCALAALVLAMAALGASGLMQARRPWSSVALACALGLVAHGAVLAGAGPRLQALWVSQRAAAALSQAGLDPRSGVTPGPVAVVGYGEPSLTFALGGLTEALSADDAAGAIGEGRPVIVEARQQAAFLAALKGARQPAREAGAVDGFDYANNRPVRLILYAAGR
jgi:4-amino-4-deoxy-L-arabinose transferase-like glycosyltransferase